MQPATTLDRDRQSRGAHPLAGAGNIFRKEFREWFRTRRFAVTTILMTLMLGSAPVIVFLHEGGLHDGRIDSAYRPLMNTWVGVSLTLGSYLIAALTMGILVKEEESGTAQWLFTKPVSRVGYVLAKWAANALAVVIAAVLIPGAVFVGLVAAIESGGIVSWTAIFEVLALFSVSAAVAVGIVVGLSAFFRSTPPIAGIAIGLGFIPLFFQGVVTKKFANIFPIFIGDIATEAARGHHLTPWEPVVSGVVIAAACVAVACYRINRRQLQ